MAAEKYLPIVVEDNDGRQVTVGQATFRSEIGAGSAKGTAMIYIQGWVNADYQDRLFEELKQVRIGKK